MVEILDSQWFWGFISLVLAALGFTGRESVVVAKACLVFAWLVLMGVVARFELLVRLPWELYVLTLLLVAADLPPFVTPRPWKLSPVRSGAGLEDGG